MLIAWMSARRESRRVIHCRLGFVRVYRRPPPRALNPPTQLPTQNSYRWHSVPQILFDGGRGEWIRTTGLLVPNQALYQAEPRPELFSIPRGGFALTESPTAFLEMRIC